ncbi:hypothetical protein ACSLOD_28220, partial [Escherichia coli]
CSVSKSTDQAMGRVRELLPEKRRKDAVLAVEYVMTASPEWWKGTVSNHKKALKNGLSVIQGGRT